MKKLLSHININHVGDNNPIAIDIEELSTKEIKYINDTALWHFLRNSDILITLEHELRKNYIDKSLF